MVATQLPTVTTETSALTNKPSNEQPYTKMQLKSIQIHSCFEKFPFVIK